MGIMEKKMEATVVYWGLYGGKLPYNIGVYMGIMEKKMEAIIVYWGSYGDNGKENGSYYSILGFIWG